MMIAALLDHLWQSTFFAAAAGALTLIFRSNSAGVRFWLWFAASAKFLIPFSVLLAAGGWFSETLFQSRAAAPVVDEVMAAIAPFSVAPPFADITIWLAAIWALGAMAVTALSFHRWRKLDAIVRTAKQLDLKAPMPAFSTSAAMEPGLVGIFKPRLILPEGIAEKLTPAEIDAMLAHEICHLKRRDNLTAALHMMVEALFWFHPLVWWIGARMIDERERACDEAVVASGNEPQTYAEGLLKVCRHYLQSPLICAAGISGADLRKRMEIIMTNHTPNALTLAKKTVLAAAAAIAIAAPLALGVASSPAAAQGAPIKGVTWLERPGAAEFDRYYPTAAAQQKLGGRIVLDCTTLDDGHLKCAVASEFPEGAGFGDAGLKIAPKFKMAAKDKEGQNTVGRAIKIPITFAVQAPPAK